MRENHTAVLDRNVTWAGTFSTEPYEAAWAKEAMFFIRVLDRSITSSDPVYLTVEVSPDGMHWCSHTEAIEWDPRQEITQISVVHFGGWLRLVGELSEDNSLNVICYLQLKG